MTSPTTSTSSARSTPGPGPGDAHSADVAQLTPLRMLRTGCGANVKAPHPVWWCYFETVMQVTRLLMLPLLLPELWARSLSEDLAAAVYASPKQSRPEYMNTSYLVLFTIELAWSLMEDGRFTRYQEPGRGLWRYTPRSKL